MKALVQRLALFVLLSALSLPLLGFRSLWIIDHVFYLLGTFNFIVHEVGHVVARPFGETMYVLGGTIAQIFVPLSVMCWAARYGRRLSFAFGWFLLAANLLEVARYVADARARKLVTLSLGIWVNHPGQGPHDWATLLGGWNVLQYDLQIADVVWRLGLVAFGLSLVAVLVPSSWLPRRRTVPAAELANGQAAPSSPAAV